MGKLNGILPIEGTVGRITFAKTSDGIIVREKGGIDAARIATDPAFRRTRENNAEFGRAGKAGRLILSGLRSAARRKADSRAMGRLVRTMMNVLKDDHISPRGQRTVAAGNQQHLVGFELNRGASLQATFYAPFTATIDRAGGLVSLAIPSFVPEDAVRWPEGATHYEVGLTGMALDYAAETTESAVAATDVLPLDHNPTAARQLEVAIAANGPGPILAAVSISFYQMVNGRPYVLSNGAYNALAIVKVDG